MYIKQLILVISCWLIESFFYVWSEITKLLLGPVFQFVFNPGYKFIGYFTEIHTFGDVLPNETVHVLMIGEGVERLKHQFSCI